MGRLLNYVLLFAMLTMPVMTEEPVCLTVWGAQDDQELLAVLIDEFRNNHPDQAYNISLAAVEESDLWNRYRQNPESVADIFTFTSEQLINLVDADVLLPIVQSRDMVIAGNTPTSIESAAVDGVLYAYPMAEDNGYFLYYDGSILNGEDVRSLDMILARADAAEKKVLMDISNGWYVSSFFFGAGCSLGIDETGRQICDFNSDAGVIAGEAVRAFTVHPAFLNGGIAELIAGMGETICAAVSDTRNAEAIRRKLGGNFNACKLPTYTLNGEQAQMGSFIGTQLMGVSAMTAHPQEAEELAAFLNGGHAQILRYKVRAMAPSSIEAAAFQEIRDNDALTALMKQNAYGVSIKTVLDTFWEPAAAFGEAMVNQSGEDMLILLNDLVAAVEGG